MATEAQAPVSQPSGEQLSTGASVDGGDIKLKVVSSLYTSVLFRPAPKVIPNFGSDCSLEWKRLCFETQACIMKHSISYLCVCVSVIFLPKVFCVPGRKLNELDGFFVLFLFTTGCTTSTPTFQNLGTRPLALMWPPL